MFYYSSSIPFASKKIFCVSSYPIRKFRDKVHEIAGNWYESNFSSTGIDVFLLKELGQIYPKVRMNIIQDSEDSC